MKFQVLSSGSKGNMTIIESAKTKIILDCGISYKEMNKRSLIDLNDIDAIFITHAHTDHISNLERILKYTKATLYINKVTLQEISRRYDISIDNKIQLIENNKNYLVNDVGVFVMELSHDCDNCNGFVFVEQNDKRESLAYVADTGIVPIIYLPILANVDTLIIEANHDISLLNDSDRPRELKNRILSFKGHLSNVTCGEVINKLLEKEKIQRVVLAHMSEECNNEQVALDTIMEHIQGEYIPEIVIAKQREATKVLMVRKDED